jgi:putative hemolysin
VTDKERRMQHGPAPFGLDLELGDPVLRRLWAGLRPGVEQALGLRELAMVFVRAQDTDGADAFVNRVLALLEVRWEASQLDLVRIPSTGPCLVVANHPYGAIEGLVLASMLRSRRPDVKLVANHLLARLAPMRDLFLFVDPFGRPTSVSSNSRSLREAVRWLKEGRMLAIFPAGEVAHFDPATRRVIDPPWSEAVAMLVRAAACPALPVYFHGHNGPLFQLAGMVHPRLRTALLPRELLSRRGRQLDVSVGTLVPFRRLASLGGSGAMVDYLRKRTCMLTDRPRALPSSPGATARKAAPPRRKLSRIVGAEDPVKIDMETAAISEERRLVDEGDRVVFWARAEEIPVCLHEIGRLREGVFREADEGTGRSIDLDRFDTSYLHLFAYDRRARAIMGAYRLGPTDEILATTGPTGLYVSSLFKIRPELFERMGPALEMGRSFVCKEYRNAAGLFLLWRGIGRFVAENPRYRVLFGPVSISQAYSRPSRELIVDFIRNGDHMHPWKDLVTPRRPFAERRGTSVESGLPLASFLHDIEEVSGLVGDLEPDKKGVPMLLKQYMKLGGKMLGWNVDPEFGGVLDGLIVVDLLHTNPKTLVRYLGLPAAREFLGFHRSVEDLVG